MQNPEQNPRYNGLYVYKIDVAKLLPGDVLLTRNAETISSAGKLQSSLIAAATRGNFSHALLCTVPPTFIEAIGQGVSNLTAQHCFTHDLKNVRLLRYRDGLIATNAGRKALHFLGREYSLLKAIRSISSRAFLSDNTSAELFCSALVATAFQQAGAPEFAATDPMKVTPAMLEHAEYFFDVTDDVFVRILSPNNIERMTALDGDPVPSPLAGQAQLFQDYCAVLLPMIEAFIDGTPVIKFSKRPTSFFECMSFIIAARRVSAELPKAIADVPQQTIMAIDDVAFNLLTDGRYQAMQQAATANDEEMLRYTLEQSFLPNPDIDLDDTRSLIEATRKQIASRSRVHEDPEPIYARVQQKWLEITDEVIEVLKRRLQGLEEALERAFPGEKQVH